jgi:predicted nuclease of predicted toxin-antitoxin system
MRFLIDECLHTSLVGVANKAGFTADHVTHLGLGGSKDWQIMETVIRRDYVFVTNNRTDFLTLYRKRLLHAGLVILVPNVTPARQRELFDALLIHIAERDLVNAVIEAEFVDDEIHCIEYPLAADA